MQTMEIKNTKPAYYNHDLKELMDLLVKPTLFVAVGACYFSTLRPSFSKSYNKIRIHFCTLGLVKFFRFASPFQGS